MQTVELIITILNFFLIIFVPTYIILKKKNLSHLKIISISSLISLGAVSAYMSISKESPKEAFKARINEKIKLLVNTGWNETIRSNVNIRIPSLSYQNLDKLNKEFLLGLNIMSFSEKKKFFLIYNMALFKNDDLCLTFSKNESYINDQFISEIARLDNTDQEIIHEIIAHSFLLYLSMNLIETNGPIYSEGTIKALDTDQMIRSYAHQNNTNYDYANLVQSENLIKREHELCKFNKDILTTIDSIDTTVQFAFINEYLINNAITKYSK